MASTIKIKNSSTAGAVPTSGDLVQGELAINVTDRRIFTENASGTVVELGTPSIDDNGNATAITIDSSENVGIGRSPNYQLDVYRSGTTNATIASANDNVVNILQASGSTAGVVGTLTSHPLVLTAGNTERMRIDSSGNVGIGTSSPSTFGKLAVLGGSVVCANSPNGENELIKGVFTSGLYPAGVYTFNSFSSNYANWLTFKVTNAAGTTSEAARIDSSGNLLVGTTSTVFTGIVQVYKANTDGMTVKTDTAVNNVPYFAWNATTSGDSQWHRFYTEATATQRGSIDYNRASNVTRYNTTSDANLKNIIGDASADISVQILEMTRIREYSWKDDQTNKAQIGVIAQELHETFKGAVSVGGDMEKTDADGNITTEYVPWSVDKTAFTFHLVRGWQEHQRIIQEQQAMITSQSELITTLTERITALEQA